MNEKQVEAKTVRALKKYGIRSIKLAGPQDRGKPDRMFMFDGKVCFVEFKGEGKNPTKLQHKWLSDLGDLGLSAQWFDNVDEAVEWVGFQLVKGYVSEIR